MPATGSGTERTTSTPVMDAPAVTEKAAAPAALRPPYQWALRMHGFENAGRAEGTIGQSKDT
ncbi:MAG: hypothetical protein M3178_09330 [Pseudomonadota bacterium]|nr:hypothetical protein [Pseudomonadota bacterium]